MTINFGLGIFMDNGQFSGILHVQCKFHGQLGLGLELESMDNNETLTLIVHCI